MNMNLARIAEGFQDDAALAARVQLLSVSFDTEFDTPRVLRENRRLYRPRDAKGDVAWEFVTGKAEEIRRLADFFGVLYEGKGADITHNLRTAVIGRDGRVVEVFNGNTWKPEEVLAVIRKL
jgi:protein SCO1/2